MLNAYQMAIRCSYWFIHVCCLVTSNKIVAVRSIGALCRLCTATTMYMTLIGMHELHGECIPISYFVGSCGPTHPSHPVTTSTTSASRYGPLKFWLLSNFQQMYVYACTCTCVHSRSTVCATPFPALTCSRRW